MDGSNLTTFVSGLNSPAGVAIHHSSQRLYWAEWGGSKIQYASLDDRQAIKVSDTGESLRPWGAALTDLRLYWGLKEGKSITSSAPIGGHIRIMYNGSTRITHLAVKDPNIPSNRENHCHRSGCDGVCVLNPTSFRCLRKN